MTMRPGGHRTSARLQAFDYSTPGAYFITIVAHQRRSLFGRIDDGTVRLSNLGQLIQEEWRVTPQLRPAVQLDQFIVMPNHFHAILWLIGDTPPPLGRVIAGFKSAVSRHAKRAGLAQDVWQRNFHERVIRGERELRAIQQYVIDNPGQWEFDRENLNSTPAATNEPWMQ